jgi:hypothetical protein
MTLPKHPLHHVGSKPDLSRNVIATYGNQAVLFDKLKGVREVWQQGYDVDALIIDGKPYTHKAPLETVSSQLHLEQSEMHMVMPIATLGAL